MTTELILAPVFRSN